MIEPGRHVASANGYRFGFNGKERDDEVNGPGNVQDYGKRIYDTRLARFLSVDPLTSKYPQWSPYPFAMNRPIDGIDMDGLEHVFYDAVPMGDKGMLVRNTANDIKSIELHFNEPWPWSLVTDGSIGNFDVAKKYVLRGGFDAYYFETAQDMMRASATINWDALFDDHRLICQGCGRDNDYYKYMSAPEDYTNAVVNITAPIAHIGLVFSVGITNPSSLNNYAETFSSRSAAQGQYPATVSAGSLPNGQISVSPSGAPPMELAPQLMDGAQQLGGLGAKSNGNTVGCCSEFQVANNLLLSNPEYDISDLQISESYRPRTGQVIPRCTNCTTLFGPPSPSLAQPTLPVPLINSNSNSKQNNTDNNGQN